MENQELITHMLRLLVQNGPHGADRFTIQHWCREYSAAEVSEVLGNLVRAGLVVKRRVRTVELGSAPLRRAVYVVRLEGVYSLIKAYETNSLPLHKSLYQCAECGGLYDITLLEACGKCGCFRCPNACRETHECGYLIEPLRGYIGASTEQDGE